ncbi:MCE family protein [Rhodococcus phenolicus]|uniref:MCE family protein n=1 Tax=Rhodococcus phenolicus TaxID=263849 RepID=UPI00082FFFE5|nr:MCE family protein [Rhodococcus phenolicus]
MNARNGPILRFGAFAAVMLVLSAFLVLVFGEYRTGSTTTYSAVFEDSSGLRSGDPVRIAGIRVGTVGAVSLRDDHSVAVTFDANRDLVLTTGTTAAVRYLNLVGDRYLALGEGPGSTQILTSGAEIPVEQTDPALDLDLLLGGFKPVIDSVDPTEVNALTSSLLQILQGQEGTVDSLLTRTSSFTNELAANSEIVESLTDNLERVMTTLSDSGDDFTATVDRLEQLVGQLSAERDPIGAAVEALDAGTASMTDLLTQARPPLAGTVDELARLAPLLDDDKQRLDSALERAPENFRKLVRVGAYGNFIQYYICAISVRVTDETGETVQLPWIEQDTGRCAP